MGTHVVIPLIALGFYSILLLAFFGSRKSKLSYYFVSIPGLLFVWNLGSVLMRLQAFPSLEFWFHVSLVGLAFMPSALLIFLMAYSENSHRLSAVIISVVTALILVLNIFTGLILKPPTVSVQNGRSVFIYEFTNGAIPLYGWIALGVLYVILLIIRYGKKGLIPKTELRFLIIGIMTIAIGNVLVTSPLFVGFPIDMLSGLFGAFFIYGAVSQNEHFQLKLRVKKGVLRVVSSGVITCLYSLTIFSYYYGDNYALLPWNTTGKSPLPALLILLSVLVMLMFMEIFIDKAFLRESEVYSERLKAFSDSVVRTLDISIVIDETFSFLCFNLRNYTSNIAILSESLAKHLDKDMVSFDMLKIPESNYLTSYFSNHNEMISVAKLKSLPNVPLALSVWLMRFPADLEIMLLPIRDESKPLLVVMLVPNKPSAHLSRAEKTYLESVASVASVAVQNANMYEKLYAEARTDTLTGIGNRKAFYEYMEALGDDIYPQAMLAMKMDDFKIVNRMYGYNRADKILKAEAKLISGIIKGKGEVFRYNNTEFLVVLNNHTQEEAFEIGEEIRNRTMSQKTDEGSEGRKQLLITISGGAACRTKKEISIDTLVTNALSALNHAKKIGKNICVNHEEGQYDASATAYSFEHYEAMVRALLAAIDAKDHYTYNHSQNVSYYATELARKIGLDAETVELVREAGMLHDLGKIGIPEHILQKPGRLTDKEYAVMKGHVEQGIEIIRHIQALQSTIPAVSGHHERYDGSGYPLGLKGEDIPLPARILTVADSFDAMISRRSYKDRYSLDYTFEELERCAGTMFDPKLVKEFTELVKSGEVHINYSDSQ